VGGGDFIVLGVDTQLLQLLAEGDNGSAQVVPHTGSQHDLGLLVQTLQVLSAGSNVSGVGEAPNTEVGELLSMVQIEAAGSVTAHGQTGIGAALGGITDIVVSLDVIHDQFLLDPQLGGIPQAEGGVEELIVHVVHGDHHERLSLTVGDQIIHDVGNNTLAHPAQLVAVLIAGQTVGQIQDLIGLGAVSVVAGGQIHGQAALIAGTAGVGDGLQSALLALVSNGQLHGAVSPLAVTHGILVIGDVNHGGVAADAGGLVLHLGVAGIVQTAGHVALSIIDLEVIGECAAGQRNLQSPQILTDLLHLAIVTVLAAVAAGRNQTGNELVGSNAVLTNGSLAQFHIALGIKQPEGVAVQLDLDHVAGGLGVALLLLIDEGSSVAGGGVLVSLDGDAGLVGGVVNALEEEVLNGVGIDHLPSLPVVGAGNLIEITGDAQSSQLILQLQDRAAAIVPHTGAEQQILGAFHSLQRLLEGSDAGVSSTPNTIVSKLIRVVQEHIAGGDTAHGQTGVGTAGGIVGNIVVLFHVGHDQFLLGPDLIIVPTQILIVHHHDHKVAFQVVHDVGHCALVHPAHIIAGGVAGSAVRQVQDVVRLSALLVIAIGQVQGQAAQIAGSAGVSHGLNGTGLAVLAGILDRAVSPLAVAHLGLVIGDIDQRGQAVDAGLVVPHGGVVGVIQTALLSAVGITVNGEVIHGSAAGQGDLNAPHTVSKLDHLNGVSGSAIAAGGIQTGGKLAGLIARGAVDAAGSLIVGIKQHHAVTVQLDLGDLGAVAQAALTGGIALQSGQVGIVLHILLLIDEGSSVAGGRILVSLDGDAGLISGVVNRSGAVEEEVLHGNGEHGLPGSPVVRTGNAHDVILNTDLIQAGGKGVGLRQHVVPVTGADRQLGVGTGQSGFAVLVQVGQGLNIGIRPDAEVAERVGVVDIDLAGQITTIGEAGQGAVSRLGTDIVVLFHEGNDSLQLGPSIAIAEVIVLVVHGNHDEVAFQVIHDVGNRALVHPAQLAAQRLALPAVAHVQNVVGLFTISVVAIGQIDGQIAVRASGTLVRNELDRAGLAVLAGVLNGAVHIAHHIAVGDIDHGGTAADTGSLVDHGGIGRVIDIAGVLGSFTVGQTVVVIGSAAGQRNHSAPLTVFELHHVLIVGDLTGIQGRIGIAAGRIHADFKLMRRVCVRGIQILAGRLFVIIEQIHTVAVNLDLVHVDQTIVLGVDRGLVKDENCVVAGRRIFVLLHGHADVIIRIIEFRIARLDREGTRQGHGQNHAQSKDRGQTFLQSLLHLISSFYKISLTGVYFIRSSSLSENKINF